MSVVADLAGRPCPWLASPASHAGIVISSRVRLARNLADQHWPRKAARSKQVETTRLLLEVGGEAIGAIEDLRLRLDQLTEAERLVLFERQYISRELVGGKRPCGLALDPAGACALMANEEDHLRLQVLRPGLALHECLAHAIEIDRRMEARVAWAVHAQYGYLTACHTNAGTGLRASAMLHLPALAETGELKSALRALAKLNLAVRGWHGEGSEPAGHLYQVSNLRTLGRDETAITAGVAEAAAQLAAAELMAREALLSDRRIQVEDRVWRAWALLTHARSLAGDELVEPLGWLRLGLALGVLGPGSGGGAMTERLAWSTLDGIWLQCQPGHLQSLHGTVDTAERDRLRADLVRARLTAG